MNTLNKLKLINYLSTLQSFGIEYIEQIKPTKALEQIDSLDLLDLTVQNCLLCNLAKLKTGNNFCFGSRNSKLVFVGESMLRSSEKELLEKIVTSVFGMKLDEIYYTSVIKCNTNSNDLEPYFKMCSSYVLQELGLIKPKIVVLLGKEVFSALLHKNRSEFMQNRGNVFNQNGCFMLPTYDLEYLEKNPSVKKDFYIDMLKIKEIIN
jgi:DNA polymerase